MLEINKIYFEDCLEGMKKIDTGSIDMILCDLPYGKTHSSWDSIIPFEPLWKQYERIIKDRGAIVLTASEPFSSLCFGIPKSITAGIPSEATSLHSLTRLLIES